MINKLKLGTFRKKTIRYILEIGCTNPGLPNVKQTQKYHRGTKLEFSCREGFEMEGEEKTECTDKDEWSNLPPRCFGVFDYINFKSNKLS